MLDDVIDRDMLLLYFKRQSIASAECSQNVLSEILVLEIAAVCHISVLIRIFQTILWFKLYKSYWFSMVLVQLKCIVACGFAYVHA